MEPFDVNFEKVELAAAAACHGPWDARRFLDVNQNQALFSLLGATYGGDGRTTFAVPKLRGKGPTPYTHYCIALQGALPSRDQ